MNAAALSLGIELSGILFRIATAAIERSDNETAKKVSSLGKAIVGGVQTTGRIDDSTAAKVRGMGAVLDKDGLPNRAEWDALAAEVRSAADRWNAAG